MNDLHSYMNNSHRRIIHMERSVTAIVNFLENNGVRQIDKERGYDIGKEWAQNSIRTVFDAEEGNKIINGIIENQYISKTEECALAALKDINNELTKIQNMLNSQPIGDEKNVVIQIKSGSGWNRTILVGNAAELTNKNIKHCKEILNKYNI
ncbi:MAG: hypothetical protein LBH49_00390 [Puniceicoccales bacterium]|nr:hypothetical protein [Puniceicoccales bacterium]